VESADLPVFSDEQMQAALESTKAYTVVLLYAGPAYAEGGARAVIWEHGRRNFGLRAAGLLSIVGPMADEGPLRGVGIFDCDPEQATRLMEQDPAVLAQILTFEVHPMRSFPGDALPS
jgi:hypothetical protein